MKGKPKYKLGDTVEFFIEDGIMKGTVCVVDKYGTFEDDSDVSYDIMAQYEDGSKCLYKHIREDLIKETTWVESWEIL